MADDRDKYRPKTPPPGIRAQTAGDGIPNPVSREASVPIDLPPLERLEIRQRTHSKQLASMEVTAVNLKHDVANVETKVDAASAKISAVLEMYAMEREDKRIARELEVKERAEAAKRADDRADAERKAKLESRKMTLSIVVPTVAAIGAIIAALAR